jgi:hypothetical protein
LIDERPEGAVDATGFEIRHVSRYYAGRRGEKTFSQRFWPKLTVVCHTRTHLWAGTVIGRGPSNDSPFFPEVMRQAASVLHWDRVLADSAYDAEPHHRLCREELGIRSTVIPLNPRRGIGAFQVRGRYRQQMKRRFPRRIYGHRWQVESSISQNKRVLGSALRSRSDEAQNREGQLRVLTHNLMILRLSTQDFNRAPLWFYRKVSRKSAEARKG